MRIAARINSVMSSFMATIAGLILKLLYLLELFLFLRLALKFFGASKNALVAKQIYQWSDFFVSPFESIFPNIFWPKGYLIEASTLVAMAGYALLVYVFLKVFWRA